MRTPPLETPASVLGALFRFFEWKGVAFCVAGDTRRLAETLDGDVDIVVPREVLRHIPGLLLSFCTAHGLQLVQCLQHESTAFYFVISWRDANGKRCFLMPDVCSDYRRGGKPLLSAAELLSGRMPETDSQGRPMDFYVPAPARGFIYYLVKKIDKGSLEERHQEYLTAVWRRDRHGATEQLERFWPPDLASSIAAAADTNDWSAVQANLRELRRLLRRSVAPSLQLPWAEGVRVARRVVQPSGVLVAVLGPDGSGKSTVIDTMLQNLLPAFRRSHSFHFRPRSASCSDVGVGVAEPHGRPPRGRLASVAKLTYYLADYYLGHISRVLPRLVRSTLVVFDRYYHDLLVDPRRYRYGGPRRLAHAAARIVPRPELVILLDAPPEVLQARKAEVEAQESARARAAYLALTESIARAHIVNANRELSQVVATVEDIILVYMADRLKARLGLTAPTSASRVAAANSV